MANGHTIILSSNRARDDAHRLIDRSPPGTVVNYQEQRRSNAQNDLMWTLLGYVSRAKPQGRSMAPHKWKSAFMDMAGCKPEWIPSLDGESVVCVGYKSSRLNKQEMSDVIEAIYSYAAEHGIDISEPRKAA